MAEFLPVIQNTEHVPLYERSIMTYNQFIQAVESKLREGANEDTLISKYSTEKNNGVTRRGITIAQKGINISPTIYLEEYYEKFQNGCSIDSIIKDIQKLYQEVRIQKSWDEDSIRSYSMIGNKIIYRLVNKDANEELLKDIPYVPYLDLAIIFYVMLEINDCGTACMLIRNEHLDMWDVSLDDVYERAKNNTWRILPSEFHTMRAVVERYEGEENYEGQDILYVLTNKIGSFGAAVILYEGCLEMIGEYLKDNFYVLPSSVHEVIIVTETESPWGRGGLSDMVAEINRTQVEAEEVLSDYAYYYDREKKKLL